MDIIKNTIKPFVPRPIRRIIRRFVSGQGELIPPENIHYVGAGDYRKIGEEFFHYFVRLGGLKPNERVLDVGCGIGRMAVPLTKYLKGAYEGFDIGAGAINWCQDNISRRYPNFHFRVADVFNEKYNPDGKYKASEYIFPYDDDAFDFVYLTSVFTHMLPHDLEHYLSEICRVLRKNGRCLITYYLLNEESRRLIRMKMTNLDFKHDAGGYHTTDPNLPEDCVAFDEEYICGLYGKYGLSITGPIHYGCWCHREKRLSYQDIIVASKGN